MRNYTIIRLFLDTGMRLSELSRLQLNEVNLEEGFVLVHGKGAKDRYVPIGRATIKCLWNYIKKRAVIDVNTNAYLFLTQRGTTLSARGIQIDFRSLKKKKLLDFENLSLHFLRHSFAFAYIENGGDPFSLQQMLGHMDRSNTSKYVYMARSNVTAQHSKYSPGEWL